MEHKKEFRYSQPTSENMSTVCFRVTRACNLACSYCQAPPNQRQLSDSELELALTFFARRGTRRIKFTGGEPFVFRGLLPLVAECRSQGMEPTIITNGTLLPDPALECLQRARARIKISLHGPRVLHDRLQGRPVYDLVVKHLRTFAACGIETSVHTLIHKGCELDLEKWIDYLVSEGVHKVSFMPFVPRGRGRVLQSQLGFDDDELRGLEVRVCGLAISYERRIVIRFLDFVRKPYLVFETDGRIVWEIGPEESDSVLLDTRDILSTTRNQSTVDINAGDLACAPQKPHPVPMYLKMRNFRSEIPRPFLIVSRPMLTAK